LAPTFRNSVPSNLALRIRCNSQGRPLPLRLLKGRNELLELGRFFKEIWQLFGLFWQQEMHMYRAAAKAVAALLAPHGYAEAVLHGPTVKRAATLALRRRKDRDRFDLYQIGRISESGHL